MYALVLCMETNDLIAISALVIFGLVFGIFTARSSNKREKIRGGAVARVCNYLASALMATLTPAVLVLAIFVHPAPLQLGDTTISPIIVILGLAVLLAVLAYLLLLPYALIEQPALDAYQRSKSEAGWTEKDARESGL